MRMQRYTAVMGIAITVFTFSGSFARAARVPRIELLREISIRGNRVVLSDLLPASSPESLRLLADDIPLGDAPQAGTTRVLVREVVERNAGASQDVLSKIVVPDRMVVSRESRPVTLNEVFDAIRAALRNNGMAAATFLQPEDILMESQVFVGPGDSGLRVMRMDVDRGLGRARFLLWTSNDPRTLPFYVTARLAGEFPQALIRMAPQPNQPSQDYSSKPAVAKPAQRDMLVARGQLAKLALHSDGVRIFVDVLSLERGSLGQQVRVRLLDSDKVFSARVDGPAHLEVKF